MSRSTIVQPSKRLQFALRADAIGCAIFAVTVLLLMTLAGNVADQLNVSAGLLIGAGLVALAGVPLIGSMVRRERLRRSSVWVLISCNFLWAIVSIVAVAAHWIQPTTLGAVIIVGQGIATGVIAEMEFFGLRSSERNVARQRGALASGG